MTARKHPRRRRGRKKKQAPPVETSAHLATAPLVLTVPSVVPPLSLSVVRARLHTLNQRRHG